MDSAPPLSSDSNELHIPVLLQASVDLLAPQKGERYLDLTAGYGGHATKIIEHIGSPELSTLVDRDVFAFEYLKSQPQFEGAQIVQSSFDKFVDQLLQDDQKFDIILLDLGVSSPQLDIASRGFSIKKDGPLDMRMDQTQNLSAYEVVNDYPKQQLSQILKQNGELVKHQAIAESIVNGRPVNTTSELAEVVNQHRSTRQSNVDVLVFQAIRIEVNNELKQLKSCLPKITDLLNVGGRLAVISFHSLEDKLVKHYFKSQSQFQYDSSLKLVNKKAIDGQTQDVTNPRARSAKLRVAIKIKK